MSAKQNSGEPDQRKSNAVVDEGRTGITAAIKLAESGRHDLTLFEQERTLGGLAHPILGKT